MNRREALSAVSTILGGTIIGAEAFMSGCTNKVNSDPAFTGMLNPEQISLLDEVGETMLPTTATGPGAKAAQVGQFIHTIVTDFYTPAQQQVFLAGLEELDKLADGSFIALKEKDRLALLKITAQAAKDTPGSTVQINGIEEEVPHYFTLIRQLIMWGYLSAEVTAKESYNFVPVPGRYEGCIDYKKGDKVMYGG